MRSRQQHHRFLRDTLSVQGFLIIELSVVHCVDIKKQKQVKMGGQGSLVETVNIS